MRVSDKERRIEIFADTCSLRVIYKILRVCVYDSLFLSNIKVRKSVGWSHFFSDNIILVLSDGNSQKPLPNVARGRGNWKGQPV